MEITIEQKREITKSLCDASFNWSGSSENELDLINSIIDIKNLDPNDNRYHNFAESYKQHRIDNYDWDTNELMTNMLKFNDLDDASYINMLIKSLEANVRHQTQYKYKVEEINNILKNSNIYLKEIQNSGRKDKNIFKCFTINEIGTPLINKVLSIEQLKVRAKEAQEKVADEPIQSILASKSLISSCLEYIITNNNKNSYSFKDKMVDDLDTVYKILYLSKNECSTKKISQKNYKESIGSIEYCIYLIMLYTNNAKNSSPLQHNHTETNINLATPTEAGLIYNLSVASVNYFLNKFTLLNRDKSYSQITLQN